MLIYVAYWLAAFGFLNGGWTARQAVLWPYYLARAITKDRSP